MDEKLKTAVVFAILMENNAGILGKSPAYIMEKYESTKKPNSERILDKQNFAKFNQWKKRWFIE